MKIDIISTAQSSGLVPEVRSAFVEWAQNHRGRPGAGPARAAIKTLLRGSDSVTLECVIALIQAAEAEINVRAGLEHHPEIWHTAPDGTPCCCTALDRKYGTGCR